MRRERCISRYLITRFGIRYSRLQTAYPKDNTEQQDHRPVNDADSSRGYGKLIKIGVPYGSYGVSIPSCTRLYAKHMIY